MKWKEKNKFCLRFVENLCMKVGEGCKISFSFEFYRKGRPLVDTFICFNHKLSEYDWIDFWCIY